MRIALVCTSRSVSRRIVFIVYAGKYSACSIPAKVLSGLGQHQQASPEPTHPEFIPCTANGARLIGFFRGYRRWRLSQFFVLVLSIKFRIGSEEPWIDKTIPWIGSSFRCRQASSRLDRKTETKRLIPISSCVRAVSPSTE